MVLARFCVLVALRVCAFTFQFSRTGLWHVGLMSWPSVPRCGLVAAPVWCPLALLLWLVGELALLPFLFAAEPGLWLHLRVRSTLLSVMAFSSSTHRVPPSFHE